MMGVLVMMMMMKLDQAPPMTVNTAPVDSVMQRIYKIMQKMFILIETQPTNVNAHTVVSRLQDIMVDIIVSTSTTDYHNHTNKSTCRLYEPHTPRAQ